MQRRKDDHVLFHVRIFLLLVLLVLLLVWFCSVFLTSLGDQVSDLASVGLDCIPNAEHMLKSTVEFKPYRPAGLVQKYLGNAFSFPSDAPFFQHTEIRIQHFEMLLEASWSFPAGREA